MSTMKRPIAVGDRVRIYEYGCTRTVTVREVDEDGNVFIHDESEGSDLWFHPKQCRRLKPARKAREFWIAVRTAYGDEVDGNSILSKEPDPSNVHAGWRYVLMREVRPGKAKKVGA